MTTGAALPVGLLSPTERAEFLHRLITLVKDMDFLHLAPEEASTLATTLIRTCLQQGAAARIQYVEPRLGSGRA